MNEIITMFLCNFNSPYIGNIDMVKGHSIYNSLLLSDLLEPSNILKVSHGIFHSAVGGVKTQFYDPPISNKYVTKSFNGDPYTENKRKIYRWNINRDKVSNYGGFFTTRDKFNPFGEGNKRVGKFNEPVVSPLTSIIKGGLLSERERDDVKYYMPDMMSFFVVSKKEIEFPTKFSLGSRRNDGFGEVRVSDSYSLSINDINFPFDNDRLRSTATNGILGIGTHKKYGYGEFRLFPSKQDWIVEFVTPYCIDGNYNSNNMLPSFLVSDIYRTRTDSIWNKGKPMEIKCVDAGQQFNMKRGL